MEPTLDLPHLNYIFSMKKREQREYLAAVARELADHPIQHLNSEWGALADIIWTNEDELEQRVDELLEKMTLSQKINQMSADIPPKLYKVLFPRYNCDIYCAGEDLALDIPPIKFTDGPTGIVNGYASTAFPVPIARGASFDVALEARVGDAIGVEGRSLGANFFGGVCINLLRHPAWGRAQETYGEDPLLLGKMGTALISGVQRHMMACTKHFAANSMENARFRVNVKIGERTLREVYLPHFKACVDAGTSAVMSAYNRVLGEWCGHNAPLLRTILKKEWGFDGFVMSDFIWGIRDAVAAANGGLDIEMPVTQYFGGLLEEAVACGAVDPTVIEESARRIIRQKLRFSKVGEPMRYSPESVCCLAHIELSREAAVKSSVLLKNDGILPLAKTRVRTIAVIGALANTPNTGDMKGSSAVFSPYTVTPLEGIRSLCGDDVEILYADGTIPHEVYNKCQKSDAVIIFAGLTCREEGEYILKEGAVGGDRVDLSLPEWQKDYIQTAKEANPRCIVCIEGGSAVLTEAWEAGVAAILYCWYPGMEGGNAIAQLLFGKANPSGKLPFTIPKSPQQLPYFDRDAEEIEYGYYHGYFLADREKHDVSYPFGFGLSYTRFSVFGIRVNADKTRFTAEAMVKNIGTVAGGEVVQLYIAYEGSAVERHKKDLKDFCKVYLEPNEEKTVKLTVEKKALAYYDEIRHEWAQEDIQYFALIGTSSRERDLTRLPFRFLV